MNAMPSLAPSPPSTADDIFVGRQPILDRQEKLAAYELLFRSGRLRNEAKVEDDLQATATVVSNVFSDFGVEQALGPYRGFVNVDEHLLMSDLLEALPKTKVVLEILETVEPRPAIVERCRELKKLGFTLALDDYIGDEAKYRPFLGIVDIVKVDVLPLHQDVLHQVTCKLKPLGIKLLAEKVDSREQAALLRDMGYDLFQGYYFARPTIIAGKKLGSSEISLMRLFGLLLDDADTSALEAVLKTEPGLTVNLVRLTNSAANGLRTKVTSLRQAITLLGRRQLQRWLQLLLYTQQTGGSGNPLLSLAASRGRFMELVCHKLDGPNSGLADQAFMTGIMSLMPALLNQTMAEILRGLPVSNAVADALTSRNGLLGHLLALTEATESADPYALLPALDKLPGLDANGVNRCLTEALTWAHDVERDG